MRYLVRKLLKNNLIIIAVISKINVLKIGYFFKFFFEIYFKNFIISNVYSTSGKCISFLPLKTEKTEVS